MVGDALVAAKEFPTQVGSTSDCGRVGDGAGSDVARALEGCAAGGARAVDLQWTELEKLQRKLTARDLWTRTHARRRGRLYQVVLLNGPDVRLHPDND